LQNPFDDRTSNRLGWRYTGYFYGRMNIPKLGGLLPEENYLSNGQRLPAATRSSYDRLDNREEIELSNGLVTVFARSLSGDNCNIPSVFPPFFHFYDTLCKVMPDGHLIAEN
jgi:hypothetical protein